METYTSVRSARSLLGQEELSFLLPAVKDAKVVIEIGVWEGGTTKKLCAPGRTVYAIDPFKSEERYQIFRAHLAEELADGRVIEVRDFSQSAFAAFEERKADVVADVIFIDGDHSYAGVKSDIDNYRQLLRPGGLLCGDNYELYKYSGLRKAVHEAFGEHLKTGYCKMWWVNL